MRLNAYIEQHFRGNVSEAARSVREPISMMRKWAIEPGDAGHHVPRPKKMLKLYRWSRGAVTPNDFYDLPDLAASPALKGRAVNRNGQRRAA